MRACVRSVPRPPRSFRPTPARTVIAVRVLLSARTELGAAVAVVQTGSRRPEVPPGGTVHAVALAHLPCRMRRTSIFPDAVLASGAAIHRGRGAADLAQAHQNPFVPPRSRVPCRPQPEGTSLSGVTPNGSDSSALALGGRLQYLPPSSPTAGREDFARSPAPCELSGVTNGPNGPAPRSKLCIGTGCASTLKTAPSLTSPPTLATAYPANGMDGVVGPTSVLTIPARPSCTSFVVSQHGAPQCTTRHF